MFILLYPGHYFNNSNVLYKSDKNKSNEQKKMIVSFESVLKF